MFLILDSKFSVSKAINSRMSNQSFMYLQYQNN